MKILQIKVKAEIIDKSILGSLPSDPNIYSEFIASKAPEGKDISAQIEAVGSDEIIEKGTTVFPRDEDGNPCLFDYQILGFFKEAMGRLRESKETACSKITSYKKKLDGNVKISPITIPFSNYSEVTTLERSLRGQTAQGERTALARSEEIAVGATFEFAIECQLPSMKKALLECLAYGKWKGLGQWRNSGRGRFKCTDIEIETIDIDDVDELPIREA